MKRLVSSVLALVLVISNLPVFALAAESDNLCEHHPAHTTQCGYAPAIEARDCTHVCTEACQQPIVKCVHEHGDECWQSNPDGGDPILECVHTECTVYSGCVAADFACVHECGDECWQVGEDGTESILNCVHTECTIESSCVTVKKACNHTHDDACGYSEGRKEAPCTYDCQDCQQTENAVTLCDHEQDVEVCTLCDLEALIDTLPAYEAMGQLEGDDYAAAITAVGKAQQDYYALTEEQQSEIRNRDKLLMILNGPEDQPDEADVTIAANGTCGDNLTWVLDEDGTLTISGSGAMSDDDSMTNLPPWPKADIKTVIFNEGITHIGAHAFYQCENLTNVSIPASVTSIGTWAFSTYPGSIQRVDIQDVEAWCKIDFDGHEKGGWTSNPLNSGADLYVNGVLTTDIVIPNSVTSVSNGLFYGFDGLTSVMIPEGITSIGRFAFYNCTSLAQATLPSSVTSIADYAFAECTSLTALPMTENVTSVGLCAFAGLGVTNVTVSSLLASVRSVFSGCSSLTNVTFEDDVTAIADGAFSSCTNLKTITIPATVTHIGEDALSYCTNLDSVTFLGNAPQPSAEGWNTYAYMFDSEDSLTVYYPKGNETWTENIRESFVGDMTWVEASEEHTHSFGEWYESKAPTREEEGEERRDCSGCDHYETRTVDKLTSSDPDIIASGECGDDLTWSLNESGILRISGTGQMWDYSDSNRSPWHSLGNSIKSVVIEQGATSIGNYAFYSSPYLIDVTISDSVKSIGNYCFYRCLYLQKVLIPDSVSTIGAYCFYECYGLESIDIPDSLLSFGDYCFYHCANLKDVKLSNSLTALSNYCFYNCDKLVNITIPTGITHLGSYCFGQCDGLVQITLPEGVKTLGDYCFYDCSILYKIVLPDGVESFGDGCFAGGGLNTITIPESVNSIGKCCFSACNLSSIVIPSGVTELSDGCFESCYWLTDVTLPNGIESLGDACFRYCERLQRIVIPNSVTCLGDYCFAFCYNLNNVRFPSSINQIGTGCFQYNSRLDVITFSGDAPTIDSNAFRDVEATAYYPVRNNTWTERVRQNYSGTLNWIAYDPNDNLDKKTGQYIWYFREWDDANQVAYWGTENILGIGSQVTEETDTSFLDNFDSLVGNYVLVETKARDDNNVGHNTLISISPVETKTGIVTAVNGSKLTIDGIEYTALSDNVLLLDTYANCRVLYHVFDGQMVGLEKLESKTGLLTSWDAEKQELTIHPDGQNANALYILSPVANESVKTALNEISKEGTVSLKYDVDSNGFVYSISLIAIGDDNEYAYIFEVDNYSFLNSSSAFGSIGSPIYISDNDLQVFLAYIAKSDISAVAYGAAQNHSVSNLFENKLQQWGGSCYGMSLTSALFKSDIISEDNHGATTVYTLPPLNKMTNSSLESFINIYQISQFVGDATQYKLEKIGSTNFPSVMQQMWERAQDIEKGSSQNQPYLVRLRSTQGGHAVVCYGAEVGQFSFNDTEYSKRLRIYDPNSVEEEYIYISDDFCFAKFSNGSSYTMFGYRCAGLEELNNFRGSTYTPTYIWADSKAMSRYTITAENGDYVIIQDGTIVEGNLDVSIDWIDSIVSDGSTTHNDYRVFLNGNEGSYTISASGAIDVFFESGDKTIRFSGDSNSVTFNKDGTVSAENVFGNIRIDLTSDNANFGFITVTGSVEGEDISVKAQNEGIEIVGQLQDGEINNLLFGGDVDSIIIPNGYNNIAIQYNSSSAQGFCKTHSGGIATCTQKAVCTVCGESYGNLASHSYESVWNQGNANGHWHNCKNCDAHDTQVKHTPEAAATEITAQTCTVCGYVITPALGHTHVAGSTWYKDGTHHWHRCADCGAGLAAYQHYFSSATDTTCDACGYVRTVKVTEPTEESILETKETTQIPETTEAAAESIDEAKPSEEGHANEGLLTSEGNEGSDNKHSSSGKMMIVILMIIMVGAIAGLYLLWIYYRRNRYE